MRKTILALTALLFCTLTFAQKYTISGYIEDAETGEKILGANIFDLNNPSLGTITNAYGFYSLTLPSMKLNLTASFIGYQSVSGKLNLTKDTVINIRLSAGNDIEEVVVSGERSDVEDTQMGKIDIPIKTIKSLPMLLGETDVLKAVQLLPGVQSGTEGTSGFYVRGGGPDQNLILLDGVPVYNVNHLFGFFSVFNADAINSVSIIKGGFPAHYGGRLSSVLDIRMKEGNNRKFGGAVSVGLISSKITLEGPIIKDRTSVLFTARRTYIDVLAAPVIKLFATQNGADNFKAGYFFYDLNGKINHKISDKDRIYLSVYAGRDKAYTKIENSYSTYEDKMGFDLHWGNITSALRWNHIINNKLFVNTALTYSRYQFLTGLSQENVDHSDNSSSEFNLEYFSGIDDFSVKTDFDYRSSPNQTIKFGFDGIHHIFNPGVSALHVSDNSSPLDTTFGDSRISANEFAVYGEDEFRIGNKFKANAGIRLSAFNVDDVTYFAPEPRVSARYLINSRWSVKAAYSMMTQYLHLLSNTGIGMPTDLWLPVTKTTKPMKSVQYAAGTVIGITDKIDFSVEGYYKTMNNLIEYKDGASFFSFDEAAPGTRNWENKIWSDGLGWSYGAEFLLKGAYKKTSGWIGYTLSWSERQFSNVSFGERFPYRYDRRHDISIVVTHKFSDRVDIGAVWVYGTGNAVTLAIEEYADNTGREEPIPNGGDIYQPTIEYYAKRNDYRYAPYHRLDISANVHKEKKYGTRTWSFGVYNAYNRQNPFFLNWGTDYDYETNTSTRVLNQYSLFPIIPSVSYKLDF